MSTGRAHRLKDLTGKTFGRLTVIERAATRARNLRWLCECECGSRPEVFGTSLKTGKTVSCGCFSRENPWKKHGQSRSPEYSAWVGMKMRCQNPEYRQFKDYGGRGIKVCERWTSFEDFFADMGRKPSPDLTIERIDNSRDYEPTNCRWETRLVQMNNTRRNRFVTLNGERMTVAQAVRRSDTPFSYRTVSRRVTAGWAIEDALAQPLQEKRT